VPSVSGPGRPAQADKPLIARRQAATVAKRGTRLDETGVNVIFEPIMDTQNGRVALVMSASPGAIPVQPSFAKWGLGNVIGRWTTGGLQSGSNSHFHISSVMISRKKIICLPASHL
jgi:hypothetical protein